MPILVTSCEEILPSAVLRAQEQAATVALTRAPDENRPNGESGPAGTLAEGPPAPTSELADSVP